MKDREKPSAYQKAAAAFKQATKAANRGDRAEAERWLKTGEKMAELAQTIASAPEPEPENVEEIRAELRARIARYIGPAQKVNEWQAKCDIRDAVAAFAREHGLPEPPDDIGPAPYTELELELTAKGDYYPLPRTPPPLEPEELEARCRRESQGRET